jgi:hypothetical protein
MSDADTQSNNDPSEVAPTAAEEQAISGLTKAYEQMRQEIGKVIVGQDEVVNQLLIAMFCRGHCLLVGVPGLAKTLLCSTIAGILQLSFRRIQFTPDLMPSDITGSDILQDDPETGRRVFQFIQGPLFTNVLLADEINRTPPKTQAALLEAMQERHVTVGSQTYHLPDPFFTLATQNPIEQEGTYPLPEVPCDGAVSICSGRTADPEANDWRIEAATHSDSECRTNPDFAGCGSSSSLRGLYLCLCSRSGPGNSSRGIRISSVHQGTDFLGCGAASRAVSDSRGASTCVAARAISCDNG